MAIIELMRASVKTDGSRKPDCAQPSIAVALLVANVVLEVLLLGYVLSYSLKLRPIADDYCFAATATAGPAGAISQWYMTWAGDLLSVVVTTFTVGLPLLYLPSELASMIPFVLTGIMMMAALATIVYACARRRDSHSSVLVPLVALGAVVIVWWAYWWMPVYLNSAVDFDTDTMTAWATTTWQNINSAYIITQVFAFLTLCWACMVTRKHGRTRLAVVFAAATLAGTGGLVFGASVIATAGMFVAVNVAASRASLRRGLGREWSPRKVGLLALPLVVGSATGMAIIYFSPGTQARAATLSASNPNEPQTIGQLLTWILPRAPEQWVSLVMSTSSLFLLVVGAALGVTIATRYHLRSCFKLFFFAAGLLIWSLIYCVINRAAEAYAYEAFWHLVPVKAGLFMGILLGGMAIGWWLGQRTTGGSSLLTTAHSVQAVSTARRDTPLIQVYSLIALFGLLVFTFPVFSDVRGRVLDREARWEVGPAPQWGMADIENPASYVSICWRRVQEFRSEPNR